MTSLTNALLYSNVLPYSSGSGSIETLGFEFRLELGFEDGVSSGE